MYGYNPYYPYQQRLAQLEQQPTYQSPVQPLQSPTNVSMLKGRIVSGIDEAKAAQVDFDGSATYLISPAEQKIYAKSIGLNGLPVFQVYELKQDACATQKQQNDDFMQRLEALEKQVKELTNELGATITAGQ